MILAGPTIIADGSPFSPPVEVVVGFTIATLSGPALGLDVATMLAIHGSPNAFGFTLLG